MNVEEFVVGLLWENKKVLLLSFPTESDKLVWRFPGGEIRKEESPEQALVRNMREDLHVHIAVGGRLTSFEYREADCTMRIHCFFCTAEPSETDIPNAKWLHLADLIETYYGHAIDGETIELMPEDKALIGKLVRTRNQRENAETQRTDHILCEYASYPAYGYIGEGGGNSITIYKSGTIVFDTFVFGLEYAPITRTLYHADISMLHDIDNVIVQHADVLAAIPEYLDNHSCDGSSNYFIFGDKHIKGYNLSYISPQELEQLLLEQYIDMEECLQENTVLDIFEEIAAIFNRYEIGITLQAKPYPAILSEF